MFESIGAQATGLLPWQLYQPLRVLAVAAGEDMEDTAEALLHHLTWRLKCANVQPWVLRDWPLTEPVPPACSSVWVWLAPVQVLCREWPADVGQPLVGMRAQARSLLACYRTVKRLHLAGLPCMVVGIPDDTSAVERDSLVWQATLRALHNTCQAHLGWAPPVCVLGYDAPCGLDVDEPDFALARLLEAAWVVDDRPGWGGVASVC